MSDTNPYSPPKATSVPEVAEKRVPRLFLAMLALYFLIDVLSALFSGGFIYLARTAVVAIAAWRTLQGSRAASMFLGGLFVLGALLALRGAFQVWDVNREVAIGSLVAMAYMAVMAGHVFLSPGMRALYAKADKTKWRGR
ncbi:MAG TPA: hypothetical protein VF169_04110 [Albitalea sp.]|uniref:hypothetical protein n=1 Tax=Piscinibacter sp. TaxID=1903157 RepID=UPI002ED0DB3C